MVYKQAQRIKKVQIVTAFCTERDVCAAVEIVDISCRELRSVFSLQNKIQIILLPAVVHWK